VNGELTCGKVFNLEVDVEGGVVRGAFPLGIEGLPEISSTIFEIRKEVGS
jgi:hypothetical protein